MRILAFFFFIYLLQILFISNVANAIDNRLLKTERGSGATLVSQPEKLPRIVNISPSACLTKGTRFTIKGEYLGAGKGKSLVLRVSNKDLELKTDKWNQINIVAHTPDFEALGFGGRYQLGIKDKRTRKWLGNTQVVWICEQERKSVEAEIDNKRETAFQGVRPKRNTSKSGDPSGIPERAQNISPVNELSGDFESHELIAVSPDMKNSRQMELNISKLGYRILRRRPLKNFGFVVYTIRLPDGVMPQEALKVMRQNNDIAIDLNHRYRLSGKTDQSAKMYAHALINWRNTDNCGKDVRVGLIDSGIDLDHPALASARITSLDLLPAGIKVASVRHGTAIASILVGNDNAGLKGIIPAAQLFSAPIFRENDSGTDTTAEYIIHAMDWLMGMKVHAINLSFAGMHNMLLEYAIKKVLDKGVFVAAAAGNNGPDAMPAYPAAYKEVVAVTAVDAASRPYRKANRGDYIEIAAPGVDVWAARAGAKGAYYSGTSFATPFVAAAGALFAVRNKGTSIENIRQYLFDNSRDLGKKGHDPVFGWGLYRSYNQCNQ